MRYCIHFLVSIFTTYRSSTGIFAIASMAVVMFSCIHKNPVDPDNHDYYRGMVLLQSGNNTVILGSDDPKAQTDEKPVSYATFTYDFYIDTTEVTIGMYRNVVGNIPDEYDTIASIDSDQPVCYVSWFDAILFCNRRSIGENLDTVYSYLTIEKTASGDIYRMVGLRTEYDKNGYRLPTEAEWIFAARGEGSNEYVWGDEGVPDSAKQYSWYNGNSLLKPHTVATRAPNRYGLYDMAGNVSEWVNDRKVLFNGSEIVDFVGGVEDGTSMKVLKGGSFKLDMGNLRIPCRSDLYPIDAVSRNHYTGFRCVAGIITEPRYISKDTTTNNLAPVSMVSSTLVPVIGTNNAKLVFVNKTGLDSRTLCVMDFSHQPLEIRQYTDHADVYNPTVSPDGAWVSWATQDEGALGDGAVVIRSLTNDDTALIVLPDTPAFVPRWYVDAETADTFLLYVTSSQLNDQTTWKTSQTRMMRFGDHHFSGTPVVVEVAGAYHGGRSVTGEYLATGFPFLKMKHLPTQKEKTLFYSPYDGKSGNDTSQVCNVSISPSPLTHDQILFLDFGTGKTVSTLTNTVYVPHEYIFMADFSGRVINWYRVPEQFDSWNHVEWSNREKFAVATVTNVEGRHRLVYCINLKDASYEPLCEGTDLQHPYLWISPYDETTSTDLSLDSIGQYDYPHLAYQQSLLSYKMHLLWNYMDSLEVVFLGSSVANNGIDPRCFTSIKGFNCGIGAGDLATSIELINKYIITHCSKVKVIGLSFDPNIFFMQNAANDLYPSFKQSKGYLYDKNHNFWAGSLPPRFISSLNTSSIPVTSAAEEIKKIDSLGLAKFPCSGWGPEPPPILSDITLTTESSIYKKNMETFFATIRGCTSQGIKILLVTFPMHPGYVKTDAYGPLGPSRKTAQTMIDAMKEEAEKNSSLVFYDANMGGAHDFNEFEFLDYLHLCETGAKKLSCRVDSVLHRIID